jgi:protein involved in polysaccharide export with SLBB domain
MRKIITQICMLVALLGISLVASYAQQAKDLKVVYVAGNVKNPAGIPFVTGMRLRDALEAAGGVKDTGDKVRVAHLRLVDGESKLKAKVDFTSIKKRASQNVLLEPYDIIDVSDKRGSFGHPSGRFRLPPNFLNSQTP